MTAPGSRRPLEVAPGVQIAAADVRFAFSRSGGPGGQAVNKLSTRAELRVAVDSIEGLSLQVRTRLRALAGRRLTQGDEIIIVAESERTQLDNRRACVDRLRALVADALAVPKPRRPTRPSRGAVERRLDAKRRTGVRKQRRRRPDEE